MSAEELRFMEGKRLYPPRFVVKIGGSSAVKDSTLAFKFEGATEEIVKQVIFTKGIVCTTTLQMLMGGLRASSTIMII